MPGLVTILFHAECLGAWASFWTPCRGMWQYAFRFRNNVDIADKVVPLHWSLVSRSDVCGWRWHMKSRECMEATLEHL
eukprot:600032-Amphidinium_carterae.1